MRILVISMTLPLAGIINLIYNKVAKILTSHFRKLLLNIEKGELIGNKIEHFLILLISVIIEVEKLETGK